MGIIVTHDNLGTVNKNRVTIKKVGRYDEVTLYFSYQTIVAVRGSEGLKVAQNDWSNTTGKLLNELEADKKLRVPHSEVVAYSERELNRITRGV